MDDKILSFLERLNEEQLCKLCLYNDDCPRTITSDGGGNPRYPPCDDGDYDYIDIDKVESIMEEAERKFIMNDYEDYINEQEEMYEEAVDAALDRMNDKNEDNVLLNIGIKKDWIFASVKQSIEQYASTQIQAVRAEVIESIKEDLIEEKFDEILEQELRESIRKKTDQLMDDFMNRKIRVQVGYWEENCVEKPIKEYIEEKVEKWIKEDSKDSLQKVTDDMVDYHIERTVKDFGNNLKKDLYNKIDDMFNQTTRNVLSDSMFNLLTSSESYRNLQSNIKNLLEDK